MKVNVPQKKRLRLYQAASSHFLQIEVDDNWNDLSEQEQNEFLEAHAWQPVSRYDYSDLHEFIERVYEDLYDAYVSGYADGYEKGVEFGLDSVKERLKDFSENNQPKNNKYE